MRFADIPLASAWPARRWVGARISYWRRRLFGRHGIADPRPITEAAPYTFFLPSENEVLALAPGDRAKLIFHSIPPSPHHAAERMWVRITRAKGERLWGRLESQPQAMPQLRPGVRIGFRRGDVIDLCWAEPRAVRPPSAPHRRAYWSRCLVDACVLEGTPVHYLYRESPDFALADEYLDSGWRIRGDYRGIDTAEIDARAICRVALGAVLNVDDGWLHLIDAPIGAAFVRNWQSGRFEPEAAAAD